jgi:hypothetical protein
MTEAAVAETDTAIDASDAGISDIEERARKLGWKPKDEYKGPPGGWRDAETFIAQGEQVLPILRERYRKQEKDIEELKGKLALATDTIVDLSERFRTTDQRAFERAKAQLEREREAAVEAGDTAAFRNKERELRELEKQAPKPAPAVRPADAPPAVHPDALEWVRENPWFQSDADMASFADTFHKTLLQREPGLSIKQNLAKVSAATRAAYPEKFGRAPRTIDDDDNPARHAPAAVGGSAAPRSPGAPKPRSWDALPQDTKQAYTRYADMLKGKGKPLTKEEWAATYWAQEDK